MTVPWSKKINWIITQQRKQGLYLGQQRNNCERDSRLNLWQISSYIRARELRTGVELHLYSFCNLGARWGWVVNATLRPPYPRERHPLLIA
jgi:hypothetical protein